MTAWILFQILLNFLVLTLISILWFRALRPAKEDPRLSRGLQLLQSKIAVLEDLIDRTDQQGQTLMSLMESKAQDIKARLAEAESQINRIEEARRKSLEVARIFQDKIPHEELLQMQKSQKYVKAAKLANAGVALHEIAKQVDLSIGELEFVTKINKDELQFSEADLPDWIEKVEVIPERPKSKVPLFQKTPNQQLEELGVKFRQALTPVQASAASVTTKDSMNAANGPSSFQSEVASKSVVKKVIFPKVPGVYRS